MSLLDKKHISITLVKYLKVYRQYKHNSYNDSCVIADT